MGKQICLTIVWGYAEILPENSFYFHEVPISSAFVGAVQQPYGCPFSWPFSPNSNIFRHSLAEYILPLLPGTEARPPCEDPVLRVESLAIFEASVLFEVFSPQLVSPASEFNGRGKPHAFTEQRQVGKVSAQPRTIEKQICFYNWNVLFLSLFSLAKNWMHNVGAKSALADAGFVEEAISELLLTNRVFWNGRDIWLCESFIAFNLRFAAY